VRRMGPPARVAAAAPPREASMSWRRSFVPARATNTDCAIPRPHEQRTKAHYCPDADSPALPLRSQPAACACKRWRADSSAPINSGAY
jgi:hypothetical protein